MALRPLLGLLIVAVCFIYMHGVVIWVTALHGTLGVIAAAATMLAEGPENLNTLMLGPDSRGWVLPAIVLTSLALAFAGAVVQFRLYPPVPVDQGETAKAPSKPKSPSKRRRKPVAAAAS